MKRFTIVGLLLAFLSGAFLMAVRRANAQATGPLYMITLRFEHQVGTSPLQLDETWYSNSFGEKFNVHLFRYYVSHLTLVDAEGRSAGSPDSVFLIDQADPSSQVITLRTSLTDIAGVRFMTGVDSVLNISGVQTGTLDPAAGMFWTWNTGYIFAKLDGTSPAAHRPANRYTFHLGGYRLGEDATRKVSLAMRGIPVAEAAKGTIIISTDILKWFSGAHPLRLSDSAYCHTAGAMAMRIADNQAAMFSARFQKEDIFRGNRHPGDTITTQIAN